MEFTSSKPRTAQVETPSGQDRRLTRSSSTVGRRRKLATAQRRLKSAISSARLAIVGVSSAPDFESLISLVVTIITITGQAFEQYEAVEISRIELHLHNLHQGRRIVMPCP